MEHLKYSILSYFSRRLLRRGFVYCTTFRLTRIHNRDLPPPRERTHQLPSCFLMPSFRPLLLHPLTPKTPPYAEDLLTSCLPPAPEPAPFMRGSTDRQYTASGSILIASYHSPPKARNGCVEDSLLGVSQMRAVLAYVGGRNDR